MNLKTRLKLFLNRGRTLNAPIVETGSLFFKPYWICSKKANDDYIKSIDISGKIIHTSVEKEALKFYNFAEAAQFFNFGYSIKKVY